MLLSLPVRLSDFTDVYSSPALYYKIELVIFKTLEPFQAMFDSYTLHYTQLFYLAIKKRCVLVCCVCVNESTLFNIFQKCGCFFGFVLLFFFSNSDDRLTFFFFLFQMSVELNVFPAVLYFLGCVSNFS